MEVVEGGRELSYTCRHWPEFNPVLDCEQSLFSSKIPAGGAARKRVRYSSREPRAARGFAAHRSPLEYRPRDFAVHPARILEQKRDCSQSNPVFEHKALNFYTLIGRAAT